MIHTVRVVVAMTRAELAADAAYRAQLVIAAFGWVVPLVMMVLWRTTTADPAAQARITTYYLATMVLTGFDPIGVIAMGSGDLIRTGRMASLLVRPVHPFSGLLARSLARIPISLLAATIMVAVAAAVLDVTVIADPLAWVVALVALAVGLVGIGLIVSLFAMLSFWTSKAEGLQSLVFGCEWLFGGLIAPLALIDGWFGLNARHQPFWLAVGGPAELVSGLREPGAVAVSVVAGLGWTAALIPIVRFTWGRAVRRHEAVGS